MIFYNSFDKSLTDEFCKNINSDFFKEFNNEVLVCRETFRISRSYYAIIIIFYKSTVKLKKKKKCLDSCSYKFQGVS